MTTMRSFLSRVEPALAARVTPHHPGLVSDLLFDGFDTAVTLLLPRDDGFKPFAQIVDKDYLETLVNILTTSSESREWTAVSWCGYTEIGDCADHWGPEDSFLRPEPYVVTRVSPRRLRELLADHVPSLLFDSPLTCVLAQPIYLDRIYASCSHEMAARMTAELGDVCPASRQDPLPEVYS